MEKFFFKLLFFKSDFSVDSKNKYIFMFSVLPFLVFVEEGFLLIKKRATDKSFWGAIAIGAIGIWAGTQFNYPFDLD